MVPEDILAKAVQEAPDLLWVAVVALAVIVPICRAVSKMYRDYRERNQDDTTIEARLLKCILYLSLALFLFSLCIFAISLIKWLIVLVAASAGSPSDESHKNYLPHSIYGQNYENHV